MAKKKKKRNISKHSLESQVLNILRKFPNKTFNYKQLSKLIGLGEVNSKQLLQIVLEELETKKKIISTHIKLFGDLNKVTNPVRIVNNLYEKNL